TLLDLWRPGDYRRATCPTVPAKTCGGGARMQCPRCKQENLAQARFCLKCGAPVKLSAGGDASEASYPELQGSLSEALARERATGEILRVIGSSPTDAQPVFETIARSGVSVGAALGCAVFVVDSDMLRVAATHGVRPQRLERFRQEYPVPLDAEIDSAQAIRVRRIFHLADIEHNPNASASDIENARLAGYRTRLMVPMVRGDRALGLIAVTREAPTPFSDQQVELLKTFADQAVIAIENVRLFNETKEALDRQTATAEILRVIASSPTALPPVFTAIAESAKRLLGGFSGAITRLIDEALHLGALTSTNPAGDEAARARFPMLLTSAGIHARAARTRAPFFVADIQTDSRLSDSRLPEMARARGWRSFVAVPMLRGDQVLGTIGVSRREPGAFKEEEIALLQTFADQAVIAIENVRLFNETKEALNRQTATAEILHVISRAPTDVQPVFDTILANAARLCDAHRGALLLFKDGVFETGTELGTPVGLAEARKTPYRPEAHSHSLLPRIVGERRPIFEPDLRTGRSYEEREPRTVAAVELGGSRSMLAVPLL